METIIKPNVVMIVDEAISKYEGKSSELIPILSEINQKIGYLPSNALEEVSLKLQVPDRKSVV